MSTPIKNKKYICHLTALKNLESIVNRGLLPRNQLQEGQFVDTANHDILQGRTQFHLGDFVPFHFDYHTAYDTSVKKTHRGIEFIYLCVNRSNASKMGFLVLPIHPTSTNAVSPLPYDKGFDAIDWNTMEMNKGKCNDENYRTQVRMAECIHKGTLNISDIDFITINEHIQHFAQIIATVQALQALISVGFVRKKNLLLCNMTSRAHL